jgi:hypothetical protein
MRKRYPVRRCALPPSASLRAGTRAKSVSRGVVVTVVHVRRMTRVSAVLDWGQLAEVTVAGVEGRTHVARLPGQHGAAAEHLRRHERVRRLGGVGGV